MKTKITKLFLIFLLCCTISATGQTFYKLNFAKKTQAITHINVSYPGIGSNALLIGGTNFILRSTDGETWDGALMFSNGECIKEIKFFDQTHGIAISDHQIFASNSSGYHWFPSIINYTDSLISEFQKICYKTNGEIYLMGRKINGNSIFLKSSNQGVSFEPWDEYSGILFSDFISKGDTFILANPVPTGGPEEPSIIINYPWGVTINQINLSGLVDQGDTNLHLALWGNNIIALSSKSVVKVPINSNGNIIEYLISPSLLGGTTNIKVFNSTAYLPGHGLGNYSSISKLLKVDLNGSLNQSTIDWASIAVMPDVKLLDIDIFAGCIFATGENDVITNCGPLGVIPETQIDPIIISPNPNVGAIKIQTKETGIVKIYSSIGD